MSLSIGFSLKSTTIVAVMGKLIFSEKNLFKKIKNI